MRIGDMGDCRIIMGSPLRRYEAVGGRAAKGSHRVLLPSAMSGGTINEKLVEIRPFFTEPSGDCFTNRYDVALELTAPFSAAFVPVGLEGLFVTSSLCLLRFRGDPLKAHDPGFVAGYLNLAPVSALLRAQASGMAMPTLNRSQVEAIDLPEVPIGEQERIGAVAQAAARAFALRRELDELERETVESAYATVFGETR